MIIDKPGSVLTKHEIKYLIENHRMIENYIDLNKQLNEHGFDVTVGKVYELSGYLVVDFDNSLRQLPKENEIEFNEIKVGDKVVEGVVLETGSYVIELNEIIRLPKNICALAFPRSTLIRSGCTVFSAVWDSGYEGKGKLGLFVGRRLILTKNARFAQMIFLKLTQNVDGYSGTYQGEGIK